MSRRRIDFVTVGEHEFDTLVAVTTKEKEQGLMNVPWPPPIMIFPSEKKARTRFWMKNTPSPLDVLFCCEGKVVDIQAGKPYDCTLFGPNVPVDLVVEMPRGHVEKFGLAIGDSVSVKYSLDTLVRKISSSS